MIDPTTAQHERIEQLSLEHDRVRVRGLGYDAVLLTCYALAGPEPVRTHQEAIGIDGESACELCGGTTSVESTSYGALCVHCDDEIVAAKS